MKPTPGGKNSNPPIYELGPDFYDEVEPASFPKAILRYRNQAAAQSLGLEGLSETEWIQHFCEFRPLPENINKPLALRYHGHQFGTYNPELGDGRGFLFAQFMTPRGLYELGTKGSGTTPYSRQGDGRLTLKGAFREVLCTENLESLGVNTSKTFSVFETGESLIRYDEPSPTRSAVLVRLSHGHIRIGTFQRLAYLGETQNIQKLVEYCLHYFYPEAPSGNTETRAKYFFKQVVQKSAQLVASYMMSGFVHGVLNTDNINITGESFDYGPYRFLPIYDANFTAAYFDQTGFYRFGRQPTSFLWNLQQLAQAMALAFPKIPYAELLESFVDEFNAEVLKRFQKRLNITHPDKEVVEELMLKYFHFMEKSKIPFEQGIFDFFGGWQEERLQKSRFYEHYKNAEDLKSFFGKIKIQDPDRMNHPYFQKTAPETLLIDEIEALWKPIADNDDWTAFNNKIQALRSFRGIWD